MADSLQPMDDVDRRRALVTWSRLLGVPLELRTRWAPTRWMAVRARLLKGQVLVEQSAPHEARVYALVSADEQLLLTAEIEQISEQLARATVYLLMDELVRQPIAEQPRRLAALKEEKRFGFDLRLVTLEKVDPGRGPAAPGGRGRHGDGAGQGRQFDPGDCPWSTRPGCWKSAPSTR